MRCTVCGRETEHEHETGYAGPDLCDECRELGFDVAADGTTVLCPTCGEDFTTCRCDAPDHAYM